MCRFLPNLVHLSILSYYNSVRALQLIREDVNLDDTSIIELYLKRSEAAIEMTARKYGAYLYYIANNLLRCREDSEEVVQDTYLSAWKAIPPANPTSLKHYLSRIVRNLSFNRIDYMTADKRNFGITEQLSELDECIPDKMSSVEQNIELKLIGSALNGFLATLSREDCAVFLLRYYYSMTIKEVAEKCSLSERRVKYLLLCLRRRLKEYFDKEDITI